MNEVLSLYEELHDTLGTNEICKDFYREIIRVIQEKVDAIPAGAKVAVRCADQGAQYLLKAIDFSRTNIIGVFDYKKEEGHFCGYPLFHSEKLNQADCGYVISATYMFREHIRRELNTFQGQVIDIYDLLQEHGIALREGIHHYQVGLPMMLNYFYLRYRESRGGSEEEGALREFLQAAAEYKDFVMIDKVYEENGGKEGRYPFLIETWERAKRLLDVLQAQIASREERDIFAFWTDAINFRDLENMPELRAMAGTGCFFENTYTNTPWTRPVLQAIFQKLLPIDGFPQTQNAISRENSSLVRYLEERGYEFRWVSYPIWAMDSEYVVPGIEERMSCSLIWWQGLQTLLAAEKPCFYIFHFHAEGHEPMNSPDVENDFQYVPANPHTRTEQALKRRRTTLGYLDQCLRLYNRMVGGKPQIFFSDHGRYWSDMTAWCEERLHTYCAVLGDGIPQKKISRFFQYTNFEDLVRWVIEPEANRFDKILRDEVKFQDVDYYKETIVNASIESNRNEPYRSGFAYRGVCAGTCKYVINALGEEYFYVIGKDGRETPALLEDEELRAKLRKACGDYFIDVCKYDKFKFSRKLYESFLTDHPELGRPLWEKETD